MKLALAFVLLAACGGSSKPAPTPISQPAKMEEHKMSPELTKFHDVLSPRWHAEKGAKRMTDTCGAIADFQSNAAAVASKDLSEAVTALEATCKANDATAFEPAFEKVHTEFHKLMEASGGGHEHGDHHDKHEESGHQHGEHKHGG